MLPAATNPYVDKAKRGGGGDDGKSGNTWAKRRYLPFLKNQVPDIFRNATLSVSLA